MSKSVLIVDDDADVRGLYKRALKVFPGLEVSCAADGVEALLAIGGKAPDLLILDFRMPGLDGLEVCRVLRANDATAGMRILAVSAEKLTPAQAEKLRANVDGWLRKPAPLEALRARVAEMLELDLGRGGRAV